MDVLVVWKGLVPVDEPGDGLVDLGIVRAWSKGMPT